MVFSDFHCHSYYSFDAVRHGSPDALCQRAIELGMTDIAITDHCEINGETEKFYRCPDRVACGKELAEVKEKYKGKLNVLYGIEMGQAPEYPEEAKKILAAQPYDFVLGSIHNLKGCPDFWYMNYQDMPQKLIERFFERNLEELNEMVDLIEVDSVAHITYLERYLHISGRTIDYKPFYERLEFFYKKIIDRGIALEINTSTLWRGYGFSMPTVELFRLYRDVGGKLVTTGSDAHDPANLGRCIKDGMELLKSVGFDSVMVKRNGERQLVRMD